MLSLRNHGGKGRARLPPKGQSTTQTPQKKHLEAQNSMQPQQLHPNSREK